MAWTSGATGAWRSQLVESALALLEDQPTVLDLKIASAALEEMREAFKMFAPFRDIPKVTIFGSARTQMADPLVHAGSRRRRPARRLPAGWSITGAGPGIMQAGMEGAGRDKSIGVSIRLPFEQGANSVIAGDVKYVSMKYFFTRKLMLIKESNGFICLPGGFGTLDETFELLTLTQTGKGLPVPIVFLDTPGDPYWETVHDFVDHQLVERGLVAAADTELYLVTDDRQAAVDEVHRLLPQLRLHPLRRARDRDAPEARADRRTARRAQRSLRSVLFDRRDCTGDTVRSRTQGERQARPAADHASPSAPQQRHPARSDRHGQLIRRRLSRDPTAGSPSPPRGGPASTACRPAVGPVVAPTLREVGRSVI